MNSLQQQEARNLKCSYSSQSFNLSAIRIYIVGGEEGMRERGRET